MEGLGGVGQLRGGQVEGDTKRWYLRSVIIFYTSSVVFFFFFFFFFLLMFEHLGYRSYGRLVHTVISLYHITSFSCNGLNLKIGQWYICHTIVITS